MMRSEDIHTQDSAGASYRKTGTDAITTKRAKPTLLSTKPEATTEEQSSPKCKVTLELTTS
jgi:hypothetical protein